MEKIKIATESKLPDLKEEVKEVKSTKKTIIIASGLVFLVIIVIGICFLIKRQTVSSRPSGQQTTPSPIATSTPAPNIFQGDDFSIVIPQEWQNSPSPLPGSLLTVYKTYEDHSQDPNAQKINFKSYLAISFDKTQGRTQAQLLNMIKQSLTQVSPNTKSVASSQENIDGQPANLEEFSINQQEVDFHVLVALIAKGDKYFSISVNTTEKKWPEYKDILYETVKSFRFKETVPSPT
jgi:hypothetical protein